MPLPALASADDLASRLGRSLTEAEESRATALLADASAAVRAFTGQEITLRESVARLTPRGGRLRLPQRPVVSITSVEDIDGNPVAYTYSGLDDVSVSFALRDEFSFNLIDPYSTNPLDVTYTHGYAEVPDDIVSVVCQAALRSMSRSPMDAGKTSETIGNYSYTLGAPSGSVVLFDEERLLLRRYKRPASPIPLA